MFGILFWYVSHFVMCDCVHTPANVKDHDHRLQTPNPRLQMWPQTPDSRSRPQTPDGEVLNDIVDGGLAVQPWAPIKCVNKVCDLRWKVRDPNMGVNTVREKCNNKQHIVRDKCVTNVWTYATHTNNTLLFVMRVSCTFHDPLFYTENGNTHFSFHASFHAQNRRPHHPHLLMHVPPYVPMERLRTKGSSWESLASTDLRERTCIKGSSWEDLHQRIFMRIFAPKDPHQRI